MRSPALHSEEVQGPLCSARSRSLKVYPNIKALHGTGWGHPESTPQLRSSQGLPRVPTGCSILSSISLSIYHTAANSDAPEPQAHYHFASGSSLVSFLSTRLSGEVARWLISTPAPGDLTLFWPLGVEGICVVQVSMQAKYSCTI